MAIYLYVSRRGVHHYGAREFTPVPAFETHWNVLSFFAMALAPIKILKQRVMGIQLGIHNNYLLN